MTGAWRNGSTLVDWELRPNESVVASHVAKVADQLTVLGLVYLMTDDDPFWERTKVDGWPEVARV